MKLQREWSFIYCDHVASGGRLLGGTATAHSEGARLLQEEQVPGRLSRCSPVEVPLCDAALGHTQQTLVLTQPAMF